MLNRTPCGCHGSFQSTVPSLYNMEVTDMNEKQGLNRTLSGRFKIPQHTASGCPSSTLQLFAPSKQLDSSSLTGVCVSCNRFQSRDTLDSVTHGQAPRCAEVLSQQPKESAASLLKASQLPSIQFPGGLHAPLLQWWPGAFPFCLTSSSTFLDYLLAKPYTLKSCLQFVSQETPNKTQYIVQC